MAVKTERLFVPTPTHPHKGSSQSSPVPVRNSSHQVTFNEYISLIITEYWNWRIKFSLSWEADSEKLLTDSSLPLGAQQYQYYSTMHLHSVFLSHPSGSPTKFGSIFTGFQQNLQGSRHLHPMQLSSVKALKEYATGLSLSVFMAILLLLLWKSYTRYTNKTKRKEKSTQIKTDKKRKNVSTNY